MTSFEHHGFHAQAYDFRHKAAVVTGSTSAIGPGIADAFAKARINVVLNGFGERDRIEEPWSRKAGRPGRFRVSGMGSQCGDASSVCKHVTNNWQARY